MKKITLPVLVLSLLMSLSPSVSAEECYSGYIKDVGLGSIDFFGEESIRIYVSLMSSPNEAIISVKGMAMATSDILNVLINAQERNKQVIFKSSNDMCPLFDLISLKDEDDSAPIGKYNGTDDQEISG